VVDAGAPLQVSVWVLGGDKAGGERRCHSQDSSRPMALLIISFARTGT
jgi:hypothetical protein